MKIFEASRNLAKLTVQFTAAGLNIADFINAEDETALKAFIASLTPPPSVVDSTENVALKAENVALKAENTALTQGLTAAGIVLKPADETKGLQASDVEKAAKDHTSLKSAELAAQQGTKAVSGEMKTEAPPAVAPAAPRLTGLKLVQANFRAEAAAKNRRN